jgi:hypothetical protein
MSTSPNEFNKSLTEKNKNHDNLIKPLIRLLKYWNALNKYPFESFELESTVVNHWTLSTVFANPNLWRRFRDFMNELNTNWNNTRQQDYVVKRALKVIKEVNKLESREQINAAEKRLQQLLP